MVKFIPTRVYVERGCEAYALGRALTEKYRAQGVPIIPIDDNNRIP
ncbi:MAG: spore photoproduct lyase, partial [Christensenellaceae bacterium]|nr:spore photoproduct lyase [Christensenellaceae bacterium]